MPNGLKLTMPVVECQPAFHYHLDLAFRRLLEELKDRLEEDKVIVNLAHPAKPPITRTVADDNVVEFLAKIDEALIKLEALDQPENHNTKSARDAWEWIFQCDGFFLEYDKEKEDKAKEARLETLAATINSGTAKTSSSGVIGSIGVPNLPHSFYGSSF